MSLPPAIQDAFVFQGAVHFTDALGVDSAGATYTAGSVGAGGFMTANQTQLGSGNAGGKFVAKVSPSGDQLLYLTEISYPSAQFDDGGALVGLMIQPDGSAILVGNTTIGDFPTTAGSVQPQSSSGGPFVLKLDPTGQQIVFSTFLDGPGTSVTSVAIGPDGSVYLGGGTDGVTFPTTKGAYQTTKPPAKVGAGFICKLSSDGASLLYSTLTTGFVQSIAVDAAGAVHFFSKNSAASSAGIFALLNASGTAVLYRHPASSTDSVQLDKAGNAYLIDWNGPVLTKFDPSGAAFSKSIIAPNAVGLTSFTVLDDGRMVLVGDAGPNFPTRNSLQPCVMNIPHDGVPVEWVGYSAALVVLDPSGNVLNSSFLGGPATVSYGYALDRNDFTAVAKDPSSDKVHIIGVSTSPDFPGGTALTPGSLFTPGPVPINTKTFGMTIDLTLIPQGRQPTPACLAMSTSFGPVQAPVVPAGFMTLFGSDLGPAGGVLSQWDASHPVPTELAGARVTVGGVPAPILYAQESQINFIVPKAVTGPTTQVCVDRNGSEGCLFAYVGDTDGLVFTVVVNEDGTLNSPQNRAGQGVISLFGVGFGIFDPDVPDGAVTTQARADTRFSVSAYFDALNPGRNGPAGGYGTVVYLGTAPLSLNGATQLNIQLPFVFCPWNLSLYESGGTVPQYPAMHGWEVTVY